LIVVESPSPRTTRGELGQTRLDEVDGVVVVNELGSVGRAAAIWEQGPRSGKVLGTVLKRAGQDPCVAGEPQMPQVARSPYQRPPRINLQQSELRGIACVGSVKIREYKGAVYATHVDESFDCHDPSE